MRNNQTKMIVEGKAIKVDHNGNGLIQRGKEMIPVPFLLQDEEAKIEVTKTGKFYSTKILERKNSSKHRVKAKCPYYTVCGGCQMMHMSYEHQLKTKRKWLKNLFPNQKNIEVVGMDDPYAYRNKMISSFTFDKKVKSGFYKSYSHDVVSIKNCMVQDEQANAIVQSINEIANQLKLKVYNEDRKSGFLRHVLVRTGHQTKEAMVVLVVSNKIFPGKKQFVQKLLKKHPEIKTIIQNVNNRKTSVVLGDQDILMYGQGFITDKLCGLKFQISGQSFYQINPSQTEKLYNTAMKMADIKKNDIIIDTYCGIGTITLLAAQQSNRVFGIEINKQAVRNAIKNAKINNLKNTQFITGDAGKVMIDMAKEKVPVDVVFMDPPRAGSDEKFLSAVVKLKPKKVVYISCNPETQARDLAYLKTYGYKVDQLVGVDMFPHTGHVETVVRIQRK